MMSNPLLFSPRVTLRAALLAPALLILGGCAGASNNEAQGNPARIIIKFKPEVADPAAPAFLATLSRTARAKAIYLRPMSGNAHVLSLCCFPDAREETEAIKRLGERADVEYAETDRKVGPLEKGEQ
jgi:hypothetical protein